MEEWWPSFFKGPWQEVQLAGYPPEKTAAEADFIEKALRLAQGDAVLDMPCGEGRHAVELPRRGYFCKGIDFNENAIAAGRERARAAAVDVDFVVGDMRTVELGTG